MPGPVYTAGRTPLSSAIQSGGGLLQAVSWSSILRVPPRVISQPTLAAGTRIAPVLVSYTETDWTGTGASKTTATVTWQTGDRITIIGGTADSTVTIALTNSAGLSMTNDGAIVQASACWANSWRHTAASNGSGTFTASSGAGAPYGIAIWVHRGSDGWSTRVTDATTSKSMNVTRAQGDSAVVEGVFDWGQQITGYSWLPSGVTEREATRVASQYTAYVGEWPDEGTAGTTAYGITGTTSADRHTKVAYEVLGTDGGSPSTVDLTPVDVVLSGVPLDPQPQPVTISLTPTTMALGGVAVTPVPQPVNVNLTPTSLALTGVAVNPVAQPVTVNLTPATLSVSAVAVSPIPGQVTVTFTSAILNFVAVSIAPTSQVTLTPAVMSFSGVTVTPVPQPVTIALTAAVMPLVAVGTNPVPQAVTVSLSPATMALSAVAVTAVPQSVTVTLTPVVLSLQGVTVTAVPGQVTVTLTPAVLVFSAVPVGLNGAINMVPVVVSFSAVALTPVPGVVTTSLTPVVVSLSAVAITPASIGLVTLTPGVMSLTAQPVTPVPQPVQVNLTPAVLNFQAIPLGFQGAMNLSPAVMSITAVPVTATPGAVTVNLVAVSLVMTARPLIPVPGPVTVNVVAATLVFAARPVVAVPGVVATTLVAATFTLTAQPFVFGRMSEPRTPTVTVHMARATVGVGFNRATLTIHYGPSTTDTLLTRPVASTNVQREEVT